MQGNAVSDRKTILVVDDDHDVREMIVEYLTGAGYRVLAAPDPDGMRHHLSQTHIDLVLLDRTMPGGDALDLVPELRQRSGLGVILVTALAQEEERVRGLELGADDYVTKPFNWRELSARVQAVLRRLAAAHPRSEAESDTAKMQLLTLSRSLRRNATILFADVEGYTRMVRADEAGTLRVLGRYLKEVIAPTLAAHGGRLVKTLGDGLFADMADAAEAIAGALAIQRELDRRNIALPPANRLRFRIAIHHAPVIVVDGGDLFGDGVNVAARLQAFAPPGGVLISEPVRQILTTSTAYRLVDLGLQQMKNIIEPIRVFLVDPSPASTPTPRIKVIRVR